MFCPNCGTQVPSNAKVCPSCGVPLPDKTAREGTVAQEATMALESDETPAAGATDANAAPADDSPKDSRSDGSSASDQPKQAQPNEAASAPEPQPQPPRQEYGGATRVISIVVSVILLIVGISRCTGVTKRNSPSTTTTKTSQSTRGTNSNSTNSNSTNSGTGHSIDTSDDVLSDSKLRDANGNITLYAFMESNGKRLIALCNMQHFEITFKNRAISFMNKKTANGFGISGSNGALDYNTVLRLKKGGEGTPCMYVYILSGYDSEKATYEGISHCTTECSAMTDGYYVAVCSDSAGRRYLATVNKAEDSTYSVVFYNPEALKEGKFDEMHDGKYGKNAKAVFEAFTGKSTDTHE